MISHGRPDLKSRLRASPSVGVIVIAPSGRTPSISRSSSPVSFKSRSLHGLPLLTYLNTPDRWSRPDAPATFVTTDTDRKESLPMRTFYQIFPGFAETAKRMLP